jgi:hypothetical protein
MLLIYTDEDREAYEMAVSRSTRASVPSSADRTRVDSQPQHLIR